MSHKRCTFIKPNVQLDKALSASSSCDDPLFCPANQIDLIFFFNVLHKQFHQNRQEETPLDRKSQLCLMGVIGRDNPDRATICQIPLTFPALMLLNLPFKQLKFQAYQIQFKAFKFQLHLETFFYVFFHLALSSINGNEPSQAQLQ